MKKLITVQFSFINGNIVIFTIPDNLCCINLKSYFVTIAQGAPLATSEIVASQLVFTTPCIRRIV